MELQTPVIVKEVADEKRGDERRKEATVYTQRQFIRRGKEFIFPLTVYLSDTNAFGNVYFAQYFVWQGKTREDFLKFVMPNYEEFIRTYKLVTVEASMKYRHECRVYDKVIVGLLMHAKRMSLDVTFMFRFKDTKELIGVGKQKIGFLDYSSNIVPVPQCFIDNMKKLGII